MPGWLHNQLHRQLRSQPLCLDDGRRRCGCTCTARRRESVLRVRRREEGEIRARPRDLRETEHRVRKKALAKNGVFKMMIDDFGKLF